MGMCPGKGKMEIEPGIIGLVKKNDIVIFAILAFTLSWALWVPLNFYGPFSNELQYALYYVGALGPVVAAIELLLLTQGVPGVKALARSLFRWRMGIEWYLVALVIPIAMAVAVLFIVALLGNTISFGMSNVADAPIFIGQSYFAVMTITAFMGYLLPRLLKEHSPLISSLIAALIFIIWYTPFIISRINDGQADYELWWAIGNLGIFFIYAWLLRNTKGGLLPLILLNLGFNYFRYFSKGIMQATPVHDLYGLDFFIHLAVGLAILMANRKYFLGKAANIADMPGAIPDS
jgi:uncharacterized protein